MSNVTNTGDIFAAFIEADKAIKELPAVREELASTKVDLEITKEQRALAQSKAELLAGTIDTLRAELAQKEAELASATFREARLKVVVDTIRGALPKPVVPAVAEPEQPVTRDVVEAQFHDSYNEPKEDITNASMDPTPVQSTTDAHTYSDAVAHTESAVISEGQRDMDPTAKHETHGTALQYPNAPTAETTDTATDANPTEVANTATPSSLPTANGPTESSTPVPAGSSVGPDSMTTSQHDTPAHKPYLGWSYWERPDHITIERFAELGGIVPSWMLPSRHNVA